MSRQQTTPPPDWDGLDVLRMTPLQRKLFDAAYSLGFMHGIDRGRELADTEAASDWSLVAEYVQRLGSPSSVPYSVLAERRGETDRAERARTNEARVMSR